MNDLLKPNYFLIIFWSDLYIDGVEGIMETCCMAMREPIAEAWPTGPRCVYSATSHPSKAGYKLPPKVAGKRCHMGPTWTCCHSPARPWARWAAYWWAGETVAPPVTTAGPSEGPKGSRMFQQPKEYGRHWWEFISSTAYSFLLGA